MLHSFSSITCSLYLSLSRTVAGRLLLESIHWPSNSNWSCECCFRRCPTILLLSRDANIHTCNLLCPGTDLVALRAQIWGRIDVTKNAVRDADGKNHALHSVGDHVSCSYILSMAGTENAATCRWYVDQQYVSGRLTTILLCVGKSTESNVHFQCADNREECAFSLATGITTNSIKWIAQITTWI